MLEQVNYNALDSAKNFFIEASRKTLKFAKKFGFVPDERLGASANVFSFDISPYRKNKTLFLTLVSEGLGTADDAKPNNLTEKELLQFWHNIGIKTMATMTNDAAATGIQPILISLYLPSSSPELVFSKPFLNGFSSGIVEACRQIGCVYFSGETPELRTKLYHGKIDIAGSLFGIMPSGIHPIDGSELDEGNIMVFVESRGPNENGFTALRQLAISLSEGYRTKLPSGIQYWEAINNPSILYSPLIQDILKSGIQPTSVQPITGHGWQKIMRSKKPLRYVVDAILPVPEIFEFVRESSKTLPAEMIKIFNYGLGLVIFVKDINDAKKTIKICKKRKLSAIIGGHVEKAKEREVVINPLRTTLKGEKFLLSTI